MEGSFGRLVADLLAAIDQRLAAARPVEGAWLVKSADGFLFAFAPEPASLRETQVRHWLENADAPADRLVVFAPAPLPSELRSELVRRGATTVDGTRFVELAHDLDVSSPLLPPVERAAPGSGTSLPSAARWAGLLERAGRWSAAGVPPLALRFYRQAAELKPDSVDARVGLLSSAMKLGLWEEVGRTSARLLELDPNQPFGRLGEAAARGGRGDRAGELEGYRALRREAPGFAPARASLIAALIEAGAWSEAEVEITDLLGLAPSNPELELLRSIVLDRQGRSREAAAAREKAEGLGLSAAAAERLADEVRSAPVERTQG